MLKSFLGGIHPYYGKDKTAGKKIRPAKEPVKVIIPLVQHIGAPAEPIVKIDDSVKAGQKIGESKGFVSLPVHSSISGKVVAIQPYPHPLGQKVNSIIIESDAENTLDETIQPKGDISTLTLQDIKEIIREAGIAGMGGATFPTHVKLSPPQGKRIDTFILNCAECEPYLTCDHRVILERTDDVMYGMKALMKALKVEKGYIGIEDNKQVAINLLESMLENEPDIALQVLETKYPQGAEKQLIKAVIGREVPSGGLPLDVAVVVNNVGTALAVAEAIKKGLPLIKRVVTVTGEGVVEPSNLEVKIGTPSQEVIDQCGGFRNVPGKIIMGGPLMGIAQYTTEVPVIKGTSGILVFQEDELKAEEPQPCIKCARCVDVCPMFLLPLYLGTYAEKRLWDRCEEYNVFDCIECGCCAYVCPARRVLVQAIKLAKSEILARGKGG